MTRLLILLLPMLVIALVIYDRAESVDSDHESNQAPGGHSGSDDNRSISRTYGPELKGSSFQGDRLFSSKIRSLLDGPEEPGPIPLDVVGTPELVDEYLAEISPGNLEKLTRRDLEQLRALIARATSPSARDQAWLCWGEDVPEEKAMAFHEAEKLVGFAGPAYSLYANQFLGAGKWSRTATDGITGGVQGAPLTVTWSIVPDGTMAPGRGGAEPEGSDLRTWLASIYGGSSNGPAAEQPWFSIFESSFEAMADTCGVTLVYEENDDGLDMQRSREGVLGVRGDIRIAARRVDGDSSTLAFAFAPDHGDIVFDSDDSLFDDVSSNSLRLFNVIGHEVGHSLGLAHVCPLNRSKLMEPIIATNYRGPRFDEYQSLQRLYGDSFELSRDIRSNDSPASASELGLEVEETIILTRLSIDDNSDIDFYQFEALSRQALTVTVDPGEGSYLEGGQDSDDCESDEFFRSDEVHDLAFDIIDRDGASILISAESAPLGEFEQIRSFELPDDGRYFVRVRGDASDAAQIYKMTLRLEEAPPAVELEAGEATVLAESGSVKNDRLDPGETIKVIIPISNNGALSAEGLRLEVVPSDNVTLFSSDISAEIASAGEGVAEIVFGAEGACGDLAELSITILSGADELLEIDRTFVLGNVGSEVVLSEDFNASTLLPDGWTSEETGAGIAWDAISSRFASPIRSVFSGGVSGFAESFLVSPLFTLTSGQGLLAFKQSYLLEVGFDGGVLEISRNGGEWSDLILDPDVVVTGGYDRAIRANFGSAIAGQQAWSARVGGFITTTVQFPEAWNGEELRLRWRLVHDESGSGTGWWIDDIVVTSEILDCEDHRPLIALNLANGDLSESFPERQAVVTISSELPLLNDLVIPLTNSGTASSSDFEGSFELTLPAGEASVEALFSAVSDDLSEGEETLIVSLPDDRAEFAAGGESVTLTISDPAGIVSWAAGFFSDAVDFTADSDGDGFSELAEYLLGTDPTSPLSTTILDLEKADESFVIPLGPLPDRPDATLGVEFSRDLRDWSTGEFEISDEGLVIAASDDFKFVRLTFALNQ